MDIHVCPLCGEVADYSDDYGYSVVCTHPPYESIEPVEIRGTIEGGRLVFPLPDAEGWKRTVGAEMLAKQEERDRKRREWLALTCDERVAERKRQEAMAPARSLMTSALTRQLYSSMFQRMNPTIVHPCPRCHDAECENAWEEPNRDYVDMKKFWSGGYPVRVEPGFTFAPETRSAE